MNDFAAGIRHDFFVSMPLIVLLSVAIAVDVALGLLSAFSRNQVSSSVSRTGVARKIAAFFILVLFVVADGILPNVPITVFAMTLEFTVTMLITCLMIIPEVLSILEKAAMLGWPLSDRLKLALIKAREALEASIPTGEGGSNHPFGPGSSPTSSDKPPPG